MIFVVGGASDDSGLDEFKRRRSMTTTTTTTTFEHYSLSSSSSSSSVESCGADSLLFGGESSSSCWRNCWRKWSSVFTTLNSVSATNLGKEIYVVGGGQNEAYVFRPTQSDEFKELPSMLEEHPGGGVVGFDGAVYAIGGGVRGAKNTVEKYDVQSNKWSKCASLKVARTRFGAGIVETDAGVRLIVTGGSTGVAPRNDAGNSTGSGVIGGGGWNGAGSGVIGGGGWNGTGSGVIGGGGWNGAHEMQTFLNSCELYDPSAKEWTLMPARLRYCRASPGLASMGKVVFAVGGIGGNAEGKSLQSAECFDPDFKKWIQIQNMNEGRNGPGVGVVKGRLLAVGGHDGLRRLSSVEMFDPFVGEWTTCSKRMHFPRWRPGVVVVGVEAEEKDAVDERLEEMRRRSEEDAATNLLSYI